MLSCFEVLEIKETTNKKEIKKAYAKLALRYHPEEHPEKFQRIFQAYEDAIKYAENDVKYLSDFFYSKEESLIEKNNKEEIYYKTVQRQRYDFEKVEKENKNTDTNVKNEFDFEKLNNMEYIEEKGIFIPVSQKIKDRDVPLIDHFFEKLKVYSLSTGFHKKWQELLSQIENGKIPDSEYFKLGLIKFIYQNRLSIQEKVLLKERYSDLDIAYNVAINDALDFRKAILLKMQKTSYNEPSQNQINTYIHYRELTRDLYEKYKVAKQTKDKKQFWYKVLLCFSEVELTVFCLVCSFVFMFIWVMTL